MINENSKKFLRLRWFHWLVIFMSLIITVFSWDYSRKQNHEKSKLRFDFQARQMITLIQERMLHYEDALRSGVALFHSHNNEVDNETWKSFTNTLKLDLRYRGVSGIGVIYNVAESNYSKFLEEQKRNRPYFNIHPEHNEKEYWPITYIEPEELNSRALGLDMAFERNRFLASKKSRDTGETQITGPIVLVQDAKKTPGFLQFVPIYTKKEISTIEDRRKYFIGHVYAPFIVERLIDGALNIANRKLLFSAYDKDDVLIDELSNENKDFDPDPLFSKVEDIEIYGRVWRFKINTGLEFKSSLESNEPTVILIGGLIIDSMLFLLFIFMSKANRLAVNKSKIIKEKLSLQDEYYRFIIESSPFGIITVNESGCIEEVNKRACVLFGYKQSELLEQPIELLVPKDIRTHHEKLRQEALSDDSPLLMANRGVEAISKRGLIFPVEVGLASVVIGGSKKTIASVVDMTSHVKIVDDLKRSNKELDDFAYVASHDLKSPLRGMIQLSNWITEDLNDRKLDDAKDNLLLLKSRAIRLEKLLDDLLSYSRVGRELGDVDTVDARDFINNIFDILDPPGGIKLQIETNTLNIESTIIPLEIICRNLLGNSIKHNDKDNGCIRVSIKEMSGSYRFIFTDDGPGIPPKFHGQVFELFKTLKPRDEVEGSGMGLSIIKKILGYYGQEISLTSDGTNGATFTFNWPKH